jgi:hypothetical protein
MFTEPDAWTGGSIDLLCLFRGGTSASKAEINHAVWSWPHLVGPFESSGVEPDAQGSTNPASDNARYGVATLPGMIGRAAFHVTYVEDSDGLWLYAGVPLGSLGRVLPVGAFPFDDEGTQEWEHVVYGWLFSLAEHLHQRVKFERAAVGWLTSFEVEELADRRVPEVRGHGYITTSHNGLVYYPPTSGPSLAQ